MFSSTDRIDVDGVALEVARHPGSGPTLVFLHEGLGSVAMWKDFPAEVAARTGRSVVVYSRRGHGWSDRLARPHGPRFMHEEAEVLTRLLAALGVERPFLVGHSDGASVALIHAAAQPVAGLVLMAPHVFVEDVTVESIRRARDAFDQGDLAARLVRYHDDPGHVFRAFSGIWLAPEFRDWNIEACIWEVRAPILVIQGRDDEYGTAAQYEAIASRAETTADVLVLGHCGHAPHRDRPRQTREAIASMLALS